MEIIDRNLLDQLSDTAKINDRLRINFNFHKSLDDKCQRLLNAMEPGTIMPIHHHKVDEMYIVIRGDLTVTYHDDRKNIIESYRICPREGSFGIQIPAGTWHSLIVHESGTVIFEVKEGPFIPHTISGILS